MNKYKLEDLVNSGTHARKEIKSNVHIGDTSNGYAKGDLLDANATAELVTNKVSQIIGNASDALDTLEELGGALPTKVSQLQNDANYITSTDVVTVVNQLKQELIDKDILPAIEYVDLGLPSGTKWGNMNVGAKKATDAGKYFQWGDTQGYTADQVGSGTGQKEFSDYWTDYKLTEDDGNTFTKYDGTDNKTVLEAADDAAVAALATPWLMPTIEQIQELFNDEYTTNQWVTDYQGSGVNGRLVTSKSNGNSVFFPAAGSAYKASMRSVGSYGHYWSSSLVSDDVISAWDLDFSSSTVDAEGIGSRYFGFSVRPVQNGSQA